VHRETFQYNYARILSCNVYELDNTNRIILRSSEIIFHDKTKHNNNAPQYHLYATICIRKYSIHGGTIRQIRKRKNKLR